MKINSNNAEHNIWRVICSGDNKLQTALNAELQSVSELYSVVSCHDCTDFWQICPSVIGHGRKGMKCL